MPLWQRASMLWRNLTRRQSVERDLDSEIRSYREMLEDEKIGSGADSRSARREAILETGGAEQIKEEVRDVRAGATLEAIAAELRQCLRALWRSPGLAALSILMLALGMGAGTAVFGIFYSVLLRPLPFHDAARVVELSESRLQRGIDQASFAEANFWDVRAQSRTFESLGAYHYNEVNLVGRGPAERVSAPLVTVDFFRALGVTPALGRDFSADHETGRPPHTVILGNRFWMTHFGGDPNVLGQTVRLNAGAYTVIGVLPPGEPWISDQVYVPFFERPGASRASWELGVVGRLKPGVTPQAARADLARIAGILAQSYPRDDAGIGFVVNPSSTWIAGQSTRTALWVLLGAVGFLLWIACLNMANLLLARGISRRREIAVRTALGAGRARLVRLLMMESLLLSGCGAALGVALAYGALRAVRLISLAGIPRLADAALNLRVLGFAVAVALLTGVLSGLAPALQAPIAGIAAALRDGERQTGSRRQGRLRAALVTGEVALSVVLLVGAGLLIRSFTSLLAVDCGFHTENRLVFSVSMPGSYFQKNVGKQFIDRLTERLAGVSQVVAAGAVSSRPVEGGNPGMEFDAPSPQAAGAHSSPWAGWRIVTPGYFQAVGLRLLEGRGFNDGDRPVWGEPGQPPAPRHVIISKELARLVLPDRNPVGEHVVLWKGQSNLDADVVGVVEDNRERGPANGPALTVYLPYGTNALPTEFVVQTAGNPMALVPTARSIVAGLDPNVPIADVRTLEEVVSRSVAPQRYNAVLLAVFAGLALLLATTGIYGVLSYSVSRRTAEIGLRMALGAGRGNILRMTIGQGLRPALAGIALGAAGAAWLSRYMATLLFGVKPLDTLTYAAVMALLLATAAIACYLPCRHAMHTDPAIALRTE